MEKTIAMTRLVSDVSEYDLYLDAIMEEIESAGYDVGNRLRLPYLECDDVYLAYCGKDMFQIDSYIDNTDDGLIMSVFFSAENPSENVNGALNYISSLFGYRGFKQYTLSY